LERGEGVVGPEKCRSQQQKTNNDKNPAHDKTYGWEEAKDNVELGLKKGKKTAA
jgi:hypothetical protein